MDTLIGSILGWVGTIGTFSAYVLLWRGRVDSSALHYSLLNAAGGFMAGAGAFAFGAWPAFGSNIVWGAIGVHGVVMALRRKLAASAAQTSPAAPHSLVAGPWTPDTTDALPISLPWLPRIIESNQPAQPESHEPVSISRLNPDVDGRADAPGAIDAVDAARFLEAPAPAGILERCA